MNLLVKKIRQKIVRLNSIISQDKPFSLSLFMDGHFYSPIPSSYDISRWEQHPTPGVDLNLIGQRRVLSRIKRYITSSFPSKKTASYRFTYDNPNFSYIDADILYGMLRTVKPKRIIEVGSGYSSALMMDTNMKYFKGRILLTCIEPYPQLLRSLLFKGDRVKIVEAPVQDVPLKTYASLQAGDILFLDSTHVSKVHSDVNHLLFTVLPSLKKGVYIHFHDIFNTFEYPKNWVERGFFWNEDYLLHAFLQYNTTFQIYIFPSYLASLPAVQKQFPNWGYLMGGSIWLKKIR